MYPKTPGDDVKFSDHYTNPLVSWVCKTSRSSIQSFLYYATGINFYKMDKRVIEFSIVGVMLYPFLALGILYISSWLPNHITDKDIPWVVMLPTVILRILFPTTNYSDKCRVSYLIQIERDEFDRFGKHVTPSWFLYLWYGVLRMGLWDVKFVLGIVSQCTLGYLFYLAFSYCIEVKPVFVLYIPSILGMYLSFVYYHATTKLEDR